jgi:hypothetical protein
MGEEAYHRAEARIEGAAGKGKTVEISSPQQPVPHGKEACQGRTKSLGEAQALNKPCTQLVAEKLLMHLLG